MNNNHNYAQYAKYSWIMGRDRGRIRVRLLQQEKILPVAKFIHANNSCYLDITLTPKRYGVLPVKPVVALRTRCQ